MIAMPDGSLTCRLPAEVVASYSNEQDFELIPGDGDWDGARCDARGTVQLRGDNEYGFDRRHPGTQRGGHPADRH